ncbi:D-alanine--D-alanine ligase family protein [Planctomicrobium piriforme]|uniref:D-alanine--D-alanine ligase n=1 Tax=Planctomicrobium piriforme TaxID=1576369 RepID=A0A1I3CBM9_9PLAN|nr:D-alanine--D-alanine ligase [Planctomicrobium piriforme]SFH71928.1 D-alanine-D-alanine ligase [Planctomicrobium piriforme]
MPFIPTAPWTHSAEAWRVAVLAGGTSAERDVSLESGKSVSTALRQAGHQVTVIDPRDVPVASIDWKSFDVAFLALHGTFGEDGEIQQQLDELGVLYTGSGASASRLAFHKLDAKRRFISARLPTPEYAVVPPTVDPFAAMSLAKYVGFPLAVKPEAQGSSLGVSIIEHPSELPMAIERSRQFDEQVLLERAIPGDEWTVPVLDDVALPPIRITTSRPFFNFEAKYQDDETRYDVITDENHVVVRRVQQLSLQACQTLGCRGMSRVDLRVDPQGQAWLLEVNTLPGLTSHSLVPKAAASLGWSMARLCEEMIQSAWQAKVAKERRRA